jgi:hypothetical protein
MRTGREANVRKIERVALLGLVGLLLAAGAARADEGRIPIFQPTTITAPGHYIVTRDFTAGGVAVTIDADNVVLDLGGKTLSALGTVVSVSDGATDITIRNGRLSGGSYGVQYLAGASRTRIRIESVEIIGPANRGIWINGAEHAEVESCRVVNAAGTGIWVDGDGQLFSGRFAGNTILQPGEHGLHLEDASGTEVRNNVILGHGAAMVVAGGIDLRGLSGGFSGGGVVEGNLVRDGGADDIGIRINAYAYRVVGNVVSNMGAGGADGDGIWAEGDLHVIEENLISNNSGNGVDFGLGNTTSLLRNNYLKFNSLGATLGIYIDGGGNIQ